MSRPVTSEEIRQAFLDFYQEMGHTVVPSSPLPLYDNPTLFFTNAGMNQFVNTFLGKEERPYKRATSSQKCMRVQGKHNDLENVGPSPRHHTFFEMLGNFSFGDYFKAGAIRYAYDFMTKVCQIPVEKLWFTVHTSDDEAYNIWVNEVGVPAERVLRMGDKTNFWMMGDIGPCGPTSEIHYDWGPEHCNCGEAECSVALDNGCNRWLEVWNLVFMQYNRDENGVLTPLPKPGVDTGMGLERITSVQQQHLVNYETDLFVPAMNKVQQLLNHTAEERAQHETGYRVIADHGRAATFLIGDGVAPGNVGGSYVLRMIIRRAARFGRKIGFTQPFLGEVAQAYIEKMGDIYPELRQRREHIVHTVTAEEEKFTRTLDNAMIQLDNILGKLQQKGEQQISGDIAFNLYATHGLPVEITRDVAGERGFTVDEAGFLRAREAHAAASGAGLFDKYDLSGNVYGQLLSNLIESGRLDRHGVDYDPYAGARMESEVVGLILDGQIAGKATAGDKVEVVTAATSFYVEAGGEVSDTGRILIEETGCEVRVDDTRMPVPGLVVHVGEVVRGEIAVGQTAVLEVDDERRWDIRRNHTATHLLHRELRAHLGKHVFQKGSLVAPDRLRFDFTHGQAVGKEQLAAVEMAINEAILANRPVNIEYMPQKEAVAAGAMALFGEKYGDTVRTIQIGKRPNLYSFELCGGLHVRETGDIGLFHFVGEEAVSAGVRRVEAVTGRGAQQMITERLNTLERLAHKLNTPVSEVEIRLESLLADNRAMQKEVEQLRRRLAKGQFDALLGRMQAVDGVSLVTAVVDAADMDGLREMADWFRDRVQSGVAVLAAVKDERPMLIAVVTDDLVKRGVKAGDIAREVAGMVGGSGGGRPNMAQAGGKDASKLPEALAAVPGMIEKAIK
jgi:alanyl-tRNA synthetase